MAALQELVNIGLVGVLPPSIAGDSNVQAAAVAVGGQLQALAVDIGASLPLMPNLDRLPERIVDLLAWQFHIDFYDATSTLEAKRARVRAAIEDHRIAGTRAGMERALEAVFTSTDFDIVEWWEMDPPGAPYTFWVFIHVPFTGEQFDRAVELGRVLGNVRSWWIGYITWDQLEALEAHYTWDELEALGLTWQQLTYYYIYAPA